MRKKLHVFDYNHFFHSVLLCQLCVQKVFDIKYYCNVLQIRQIDNV